jgi:hypothetical protein
MGIANLVAAHKPTENAKLDDQIQTALLSSSHARAMSAMFPSIH